MVAIADERDVYTTQAALGLGCAIPGLEAVLGVGGGEDDGAGARVEELLQASRKGADLGRTDEGPGFGEEDQNEPVVGLGVR